jgi:hypothetical protein
MIARVLTALVLAGLAAPVRAEPAPPPILLGGPSASHGPGDREGGAHGPGGEHHRRQMQIFLSPAGEPFRASPQAPYPVAEWFAKADADHDGFLTQAEMTADFNRFFDRLDANHDAVIDGFEIQDYEHKIAPEILSQMDLADEERIAAGVGDSAGGGRGRGGPKGGTTLQGAAAYSLLNLPEPVAGGDQDFDGKVTRVEWEQAAKSRFRILDKKAAGRIALTDLPLARAQRLEQEAQQKRKSGKGGDEHAPPGDGPSGSPPDRQ